MRNFFVALFLLAAVTAWAGIPDPQIYKWGKLEVPENHDQPQGAKIQVYWEKLTSTHPSPQAIVMINGGPGTTHESFHVFNEQGGLGKDYFFPLRDHFEVYYFDQRGNGNSTRLSLKNCAQHDLTRFGTADICRDIEELRRRVIRQDRIAVFGESYGGMVALFYATHYPQSVSRLVIHDSSPSNRYFTNLYRNFSNQLANLDAAEFPGMRKHFRRALQRLAEGSIAFPGNVRLAPGDFLTRAVTFTYSFRGLTILANMVKDLAESGQSKALNAVLGLDAVQRADSLDAGPSPTLLAIQGLEMLDEAEVGRLAGLPTYDPWSLAWAQESMFASRRGFKRDAGLEGFPAYDVVALLPRIIAPTLVVVGKYDFVCPPVYAREIQKGIGAHCRVLTVDQAAHGAFDEKREFTVGAIRAFLLPGVQCADVLPPPRLSREALSQPPRHKDIIDIYLEGTRRMKGLLLTP